VIVATDEQYLRVTIADLRFEVRRNEREPCLRAPMAEKVRLDVFGTQGRSQKRIVAKGRTVRRRG
jgi:hypothetical protein